MSNTFIVSLNKHYCAQAMTEMSMLGEESWDLAEINERLILSGAKREGAARLLS